MGILLGYSPAVADTHKSWNITFKETHRDVTLIKFRRFLQDEEACPDGKGKA